MAKPTELTTLWVKHHQWEAPPIQATRVLEQEPPHRRSYTPRTHARPKRLSKTECRELFNATNSLPSIHIHGSACRCSETQTENQLEDTLLAERISSLTQTLLITAATSPTKPPPPVRDGPQSHRRSPRPGAGILSALTRLFSPPPWPMTASFPLQADLCVGCANLDIDKVARYLVLDPSPLPVNVPNHMGILPLMAAVRSPAAATRPKAHLEMVRFLVDVCGADVEGVRVDRVTGAGESVLSMACEVGTAEVVRFLMARGAEVNRKLPYGAGMGKGMSMGRGRSALHVAVLAGSAECAAVLVREGPADIHAVFDASTTGCEDRAGADGGLKGLRGGTRSASREVRGKRPRNPVTALHLAHGSDACTRILLACGANVGAKDGDGRTPLHWAAGTGNFDVVRLLVNAGADINAAAKDGLTPLAIMLAFLEDEKVNQEQVGIAKLLFREEMDTRIEYRDEKMRTEQTVPL